MSEAEKDALGAAKETRHSPYRIAIIGTVITTLGSIIAAVAISLINGDSGTASAPGGVSAITTTTLGQRARNPSNVVPMLDAAHRASFIAQMSGDVRVDNGLDINGERFVYGASTYCEIGCGLEYEEFIEFNLGRDYRTFRATLGLADRSAQAYARRIRVVGDGQLLYEREFAIGQSEAVELDVTSVLRLRIEMLSPHFVFAAVGDPTVEK